MTGSPVGLIWVHAGILIGRAGWLTGVLSGQLSPVKAQPPTHTDTGEREDVQQPSWNILVKRSECTGTPWLMTLGREVSSLIGCRLFALLHDRLKTH